MSETKLLFSNRSTEAEDRTQTPGLWTHSDNTFKFNFFPDTQRPSPSDPILPELQPTGSQVDFTGQAFAFNFQIPAEDDLKMSSDSSSHLKMSSDSSSRLKMSSDSSSRLNSQRCETDQQQVESVPASKTQKKKKKKSSKQSVSEEPHDPTDEGTGNSALNAEEQLKRELEWCIEQLEMGLRTQKGTTKQKEETSRVLKTLRSSKAPVAKKRQVMRNTMGDYRSKMEEDKSRQFKLIQSEVSSSRVKSVPSSSTKSAFRRKTEGKCRPTVPGEEEKLEGSTFPGEEEKLEAPTPEETAAFVFTPSKEPFHFSFL